MPTYNSWPLGKLPEKFQRKEPHELRDAGFQWEDPREINTEFERRLEDYTGAPHVILTDCCTHALQVSLGFLLETGRIDKSETISIPRQTYVSVPMTLYHLGLPFTLRAEEWSGEYQLGTTGVFDSAARFTSGMYSGAALAQCLSFQIKKRLPIGRGGAILTGDAELAEWARYAVYDGRDLTTPYDSIQHLKAVGWHFYMTPEDAARGILLLEQIPRVNDDTMTWSHYPDLREWKVIAEIEHRK